MCDDVWMFFYLNTFFNVLALVGVAIVWHLTHEICRYLRWWQKNFVNGNEGRV